MFEYSPLLTAEGTSSLRVECMHVSYVSDREFQVHTHIGGISGSSGAWKARGTRGRRLIFGREAENSLIICLRQTDRKRGPMTSNVRGPFKI